MGMDTQTSFAGTSIMNKIQIHLFTLTVCIVPIKKKKYANKTNTIITIVSHLKNGYIYIVLYDLRIEVVWQSFHM